MITVSEILEYAYEGEFRGWIRTLVTGATRLAAAQKLGWLNIECFIAEDCDEIDAKLIEIAENLHRAELTALERDEQIAEWARLCKEKKVRQLDEPGGRQPKEKGQSQAARKLGISEPAARRAVKINSLSDEAKQAAKEKGLDNNQTALLGATTYDNPDDQVKFPRNYRQEPMRITNPAEDQYLHLVRSWDRALHSARERFLEYIDRPPAKPKFSAVI